MLSAAFTPRLGSGLQLVSRKHLLCKVSLRPPLCPGEVASVTQQLGLQRRGCWDCFWSAVSGNRDGPSGFIFSSPFHQVLVHPRRVLVAKEPPVTF